MGIFERFLSLWVALAIVAGVALGALLPDAAAAIEALGGGERCVCELTEELALAQSKLSFHLKVLREAGLLADRQSGRWVYYRLQPEALERLRGWLAQLAAGCTTPAHPCC